MLEAELKYAFAPEDWGAIKEKLTTAFTATYLGQRLYEDTYYDSPDGDFYTSEKELRIRTFTDLTSKKKRTILTFKDAPFDMASRSKREYEVTVDKNDELHNILEGLGYVQKVLLTKNCEAYSISKDPYRIEVVGVTIDQLEMRFIELEVQCETENAARSAIEYLRPLSADLGLSERQRCHEYYTDMVLASIMDNA